MPENNMNNAIKLFYINKLKLKGDMEEIEEFFDRNSWANNHIDGLLDIYNKYRLK